mmetsp:Transcript_86732/g.269646  ORF Transcript_86732/g.269646 Transcript_86732/m.269646 type:complete len:241 (-) Transcript_86732:670-1392(-)
MPSSAVLWPCSPKPFRHPPRACRRIPVSRIWVPTRAPSWTCAAACRGPSRQSCGPPLSLSPIPAPAPSPRGSWRKPVAPPSPGRAGLLRSGVFARRRASRGRMLPRPGLRCSSSPADSCRAPPSEPWHRTFPCRPTCSIGGRTCRYRRRSGPRPGQSSSSSWQSGSKQSIQRDRTLSWATPWAVSSASSSLVPSRRRAGGSARWPCSMRDACPSQQRRSPRLRSHSWRHPRLTCSRCSGG